MKNLILLLIVFVSFASCRSFKLSDHYKNDRVVQKLPLLEADFDRESFGPHFNPYEVAIDVITGQPDLPERYLTKVDIQTALANDVSVIYKRELLNNICERKGSYGGIAYCKMGTRNTYIKNYWPPVISVVTLGLANIAGMKFKRQVYEVEILVEILDNDNNHVATYTGLGKGEADVGFYNKYDNRNGHRTAFAIAFTNALAEIKHKMRSDHGELLASLTY